MADVSTAHIITGSNMTFINGRDGSGIDIGTPHVHDLTKGFGAGGGGVQIFFQRVFDLTLNRFCYFTDYQILTNPTPAKTTPNHTNNLKPDSHEIVEIINQ